jgi:hypothetical protein
MAFATTNVRKDTFGSLKVTAGQWSGADGDAAGSFKVEGGVVYLCLFTSQDASGNQILYPIPYSVSGTSGVVTITVANYAGVTAGSFVVIHL